MTYDSQYPHRKSDALVAIIKEHGKTQIFYRAKRVGKNCPLSSAERHIYVTQGPVRAVRIIKAARSISLSEAIALLNSARFPTLA